MIGRKKKGKGDIPLLTEVVQRGEPQFSLDHPPAEPEAPEPAEPSAGSEFMVTTELDIDAISPVHPDDELIIETGPESADLPPEPPLLDPEQTIVRPPPAPRLDPAQVQALEQRAAEILERHLDAARAELQREIRRLLRNTPSDSE
jgi:hypothetical protein